MFADDPGFAAWLADLDPALTEAEMLPTSTGTWTPGAPGAERFYPGLTDADVQAMAGLPGSEGAFRRVTPDS